jgi:hypothetical protein
MECRVFAAAVLIALSAPATLHAAGKVDKVKLDFEDGAIDPKFVPCNRPENETIAVSTEMGRDSKKSLRLPINVLPLFPGDVATLDAMKKAKRCLLENEIANYRGDEDERAELWEDKAYSPNFGTEVWYGFSMYVTRASVPPDDFNRVVLGQWKASYPEEPPSDYSPFLGQRLTGGFYHITLDVDAVEPDAPKDFEGGRKTCKLLLAFAKSAPSKFDAPLDLERPGKICEVRLEHSNYALEPVDPPDIKRFAYLPDPFDKWTDVVVGMKAGKGGFVELWVDGQRIARADGKIGHDAALVGQPQYFKFGPYRDPAGYPFEVYLDNLARGEVKDEVDPAK